MGTANAANTGQVTIVCANDAGEQREYRVGWDNSNPFFNGKGDIAALFCDIGTQNQYKIFVSTTLTDSALRYYNGAIPNQIVIPIADTPTATVETQTVAPPQETSTSVVPSDTPTAVVDSPTPTPESVTTVSDTLSVQHPVETPTVVDTQTSESSTQTILPETGTPVAETPLPTPVPAVEPPPVVAAEPPATPQPEPAPAPAPEPTPEEPPVEEVAPEPAPPAPEEQPPADAPSEPPVVEDTNEIPSDPAPEEQPAPTPLPLPQPVSVPEPTSQPDIASEPPIIQVNNVDLNSLPPDTPVQLDNGVVVTAEVAIQVALLQDPGELLSELFTNPAAAFAALGAVGADMSPESRAKSEKAVIQAVVVGSIVTQAAGAAAYRRKP